MRPVYYSPIKVRVYCGQSKGPVLEQGLEYSVCDALDVLQR